MLHDIFDVDSWWKFAIFMAGSAWLAAVGIAAFWLKRVIVRHESEADREAAKRRSKHNSHAAAASGSSHAANRRDSETRE